MDSLILEKDSYGSPIAHSSPCTTQPEPPLREKIKVRNKNNNLRAIVINFQSLKNKKPDLQLTIDNTNPDIIFGCETWLHKKIDTLEILPDNYTVYRKDRSSKGGGVLLPIKNSINSSTQVDLDTDAELIWTKILAKKQPRSLHLQFLPTTNRRDRTDPSKTLNKQNQPKWKTQYMDSWRL